jgi:hypothetical protein
MVERVHSNELKNFPIGFELPELPVFERPQQEPWPLAISWLEATQQMAPFRDYYMLRHDSPLNRFQNKNPEPFILD